jgi:hypothetical protein
MDSMQKQALTGGGGRKRERNVPIIINSGWAEIKREGILRYDVGREWLSSMLFYTLQDLEKLLGHLNMKLRLA